MKAPSQAQVLAAVAMVFLFALLFAHFSQSPATSFNSSQQGGHLQYGVVIDCGSSGSRLFIYSWPSHVGPKSLQQVLDNTGEVVVKKVEPGLSAAASNPDLASDHIAELLQYAEKHIPTEEFRTVLVYVLATAGMRLLSTPDRDAIVADVVRDIPHQSQLPLLPAHIQVISGEREGMFAWLSLNHALNQLSGERTVGMMDLGGGSMQVAFELPPGDGSATVHVELPAVRPAHEYRLFVQTFLGLGANSAQKLFQASLSQKAVRAARRDSTSLEPSNVIPKLTLLVTRQPAIGLTADDPCAPRGLNRTFDSGLLSVGRGEWRVCRQILSQQLRQISKARAGCGLFCDQGVTQLPPDFLTSQFFGFSEFWYSTEDVLQMGGHYNREEFEAAASEFCNQSWSQIQQKVAAGSYDKADAQRLRNQCFKSAWVSVLLHDGFLLPSSHDRFSSISRVRDREVHWSLGALLFHTRYQDGDHHVSVVRNSYYLTVFHNDAAFFVPIVLVLALLLLYCYYFSRPIALLHRSNSTGRFYSLI